jgi:hypothetical protein
MDGRSKLSRLGSSGAGLGSRPGAAIARISPDPTRMPVDQPLSRVCMVSRRSLRRRFVHSFC